MRKAYTTSVIMKQHLGKALITLGVTLAGVLLKPVFEELGQRIRENMGPKKN